MVRALQSGIADAILSLIMVLAIPLCNILNKLYRLLYRPITWTNSMLKVKSVFIFVFQVFQKSEASMKMKRLIGLFLGALAIVSFQGIYAMEYTLAMMLDDENKIEIDWQVNHPTQFFVYVWQERIHELKQLLSTGRVNVNQRYDEKYDHSTALHIAAAKASPEALKALLESKGMRVDVNARDSVGCTPLIIAALWGRIENVRLLLEAKAAVDAQDRQGDTALHHAMRNYKFYGDTGGNFLKGLMKERMQSIIISLMKIPSSRYIRNRKGKIPMDYSTASMGQKLKNMGFWQG